ncbi:MAG: VOC family protein [Candidatus Omnitrophica bacterium]|nr:VOC family protein [Candidatus Omnitrophota bacterium]MDD5429918.1 VOC family protein [Candidatus Omnitrophota bacterium]
MKAIRHTGIVVENLDKALVFYRDILGLKVSKQAQEPAEYIGKLSGLNKDVKLTTVKLSADDGNLVELLHCPSCSRKLSTDRSLFDKGISHIAFSVADLDFEYKRLAEAGVKFNSSPCVSPNGYAKVVFCQDPEGNFIELVQVL